MNKYNSSNMNWLNIITIKDFQNCVDLRSLEKISMSSKLVREKLNPVLFKHLILRSNNLISICSGIHDTIFMEFYKCFYLPESNISLPLKGKDWNIQSDLSKISTDLMNIGKYVKSFNLDGLDRSGYYMFKIINNFHNLKFLELRLCFIPYLEFTRIGELLPNLTSIKLISLYLTKLPKNNSTLDNFIFPQNLSYLELYNCRLINSSLLTDPHKFLFSEDTTQETIVHFNLPNVCVPSLKHLAFFTYYLEDGGLENFLKINPNLESLHIESYNLRAIKSLNSLNSLKIIDNISFDCGNIINALKFLKKLEIEIQGHHDYEYINSLCQLCYNLEYLHITMRSIEKLQQIIDTCVAPTIYNLPLLKTLSLTIHKEECDAIDISKFSLVEKLVIKASSVTLFNLDFASCSKLKKVELTSYSGNIDKSEFTCKFTRYDNWIFKYFDHTIRGNKLDN